MKQLLILLLSTYISSCEQTNDPEADQNEVYANVTEVSVSGSEESYTFNITISSPDKGCEQYADWWEVVSELGELLYRRILTHSHVSEQPFTRSGGKVSITKDQVVWVRAHMNKSGYGGKVMKGSVAGGFVISEIPDGFASDLDQVKPLPDECRF